MGKKRPHVNALTLQQGRLAEYWVLEVAGRRMFVHRNPSAGKYTDVAVYGDPESVSPLAAPNAQFPVAHAFQVPPAASRPCSECQILGR